MSLPYHVPLEIIPSAEWNTIIDHFQKDRKKGTAVILSGTSSIVVPHGLAAVPDIVIAMGRDLETDELRCSARDATNFTLSVPANVSANRTVDWMAEV